MRFGAPAGLTGDGYAHLRSEEVDVALPEVVSRDEWLAARRDLLAREKELTRLRDRLNADRRRLPMVRVEKEYRFAGPEREASLVDLFDGCRQLIVQHFMFDPAWKNACPSCTAGADELAPGLLEHLRARQTAFAAVSRAPIEKIEAWRTPRVWTFPWYSSFGSDFNYDFGATLDDSVTDGLVNFRPRADWCASDDPNPFAHSDDPVEVPGFSCFLRDGDAVHHTYSTYARGAEAIGGAYAFLDLTALGRQEDWEEPKGRVAAAREAVPDFAA
jgi:predicted dithiol-disulfide oxidoreductase (DUF899 family)